LEEASTAGSLDAGPLGRRSLDRQLGGDRQLFKAFHACLRVVRRAFVGLIRDHRTRVGRIRAVVKRGRESEGENRERLKSG